MSLTNLERSPRTHGGPDAQGVAPHDFSTNSNACGPCPLVVQALRAVDARHYPDPEYTALRETLARFHGVSPARVVIAGSSSEAIQRLTLWAVRQGAVQVTVPRHHYGDYADAAALWGLPLHRRGDASLPCGLPGLHWACEPSSPLGVAEPPRPELPGLWVLDAAYAPLRLAPTADADWRTPLAEPVWQLWTPNKALGLTGVRAAYAIAPPSVPPGEVEPLRRMAPSWVLGAHGVAFLQAWTQPAVQHWLQGTLPVLHAWKQSQIALCERLGWTVWPGHLGPYFVARWPEIHQPHMQEALAVLRSNGVALRDAASFGLPGHVRLGVRPPASQAALERAWRHWQALLNDERVSR